MNTIGDHYRFAPKVLIRDLPDTARRLKGTQGELFLTLDLTSDEIELHDFDSANPNAPVSLLEPGDILTSTKEPWSYVKKVPAHGVAYYGMVLRPKFANPTIPQWAVVLKATSNPGAKFAGKYNQAVAALIPGEIRDCQFDPMPDPNSPAEKLLEQMLTIDRARRKGLELSKQLRAAVGHRLLNNLPLTDAGPSLFANARL